MIENYEQFMPVMASIPTADIIGGILLAASVTAAIGMIIYGNWEVKKLRRQNHPRDQIPGLLRERHRDERKRERRRRTNDTLRGLQ